MTVFGLALVLAAACCHATWNLLLKRLNGGPELVWLFSIITAVVYLPAVVYVLVFDQPVIAFWDYVFILGSAFIHMGYFLLLQTGYRKGDLSIVYPTARATGPLLATTFAVIMLGDILTAQIAIGAIIVIVGVFCLTGGLKAGARPLTTSTMFGICTGCLIATYTIWDAYAVSILLISPIILDYGSSILRSTLLAPVAFKRWSVVKGYWHNHKRVVLAIAVFNPLAYILVLYAFSFTPVVYVAPLRETSVVITVLMGSIFLGEGDLKRRLGWAGVILLGVALLASS